jgi:hypothetical protein
MDGRREELGMQRRTKRRAKNHANTEAKRRPQATTSGVGLWSVKPGADLSLLLSRVRAVQVRRLHLR